MKKLVAILVVFALAAGFAFAQANFGGSVGMAAVLLEGDNAKVENDKGEDTTKPVSARFGDMWGSLWWNWANDENTAGASFDLSFDLGDFAWASDDAECDDCEGCGIDGVESSGDGISGKIWWRPIHQLKLEIFSDDGAFYRGNAISWGYHANSAAGNVATIGSWNDSGWNSFSGGVLSGDNNVGFFRGYIGRGMALHLYPVDGLELGVALPLGGDLKDLNITAHAGYEINGIGKLNMSFRREYDFASWTGWAGNLTAPTLGVDFTTWALPGINIEVGALIPFSGRYVHGWWFEDEDNDSVNLPISIGVGFTMNQWSGEAFHLYARAGVMLPTEFKLKGYPWAGDDFDFSDTTVIGLGINPSYDLGFGRMFFDFGIGMVMGKDAENKDATDFYWHFNPYLRKSIGVGDLYVGLNVWNGTGMGGYEAFPTIFGKGSTDVINFAIPIYFELGF